MYMYTNNMKYITYILIYILWLPCFFSPCLFCLPPHGCISVLIADSPTSQTQTGHLDTNLSHTRHTPMTCALMGYHQHTELRMRPALRQPGLLRTAVLLKWSERTWGSAAAGLMWARRVVAAARCGRSLRCCAMTQQWSERTHRYTYMDVQ